MLKLELRSWNFFSATVKRPKPGVEGEGVGHPEEVWDEKVGGERVDRSEDEKGP